MSGDLVAVVLFAFFKAFFATNFYGKMSHTWSLAVEFQMYIFSPFYVKYLNRATLVNARASVIVISLVSIVLNAVLIVVIFGRERSDNDETYWFQVY